MKLNELSFENSAILNLLTSTSSSTLHFEEPFKFTTQSIFIKNLSQLKTSKINNILFSEKLNNSNEPYLKVQSKFNDEKEILIDNLKYTSNKSKLDLFSSNIKFNQYTSSNAIPYHTKTRSLTFISYSSNFSNSSQYYLTTIRNKFRNTEHHTIPKLSVANYLFTNSFSMPNRLKNKIKDSKIDLSEKLIQLGKFLSNN